jgi:hypothetical protein
MLTDCSDKYGEVVTVAVGSEALRREFYIHTELLLHYSSYFRKALSPAWIEGQTKSIVLSKDSPTIFQTFFHWIYSGKLYSTLTNGFIPISFKDICALYVFGDARGIPDLCNAAVDVLFQKVVHEWGFHIHCLPYVYDNTLAGSNLRKTIVDLSVCCFSFGSLETREQLFPKKFLIDVIVRSRQLNAAPGSLPDKSAFLKMKATEMCTYHDHECPHDLDKNRAS